MGGWGEREPRIVNGGTSRGPAGVGWGGRCTIQRGEGMKGGVPLEG